MKKMILNRRLIRIGLIGLSLYISTCDFTTAPESPNQPPNTTLANIPVDDDTLFALVTLHWDGEDEDGYITGYQYRYITHHLQVGDSVVQEWKNIDETSLELSFESSDVLNYQKFQVRSVDNLYEVDPTPAQKCFYTTQSVFPITEIVSPEANGKFFVIEQVTDWWQGIYLNITGKDKDGEITEYAWAVDSGEWHWSADTAIYIEPQNFDPLEGEHVIKVTSRDNTNLIDPVGDSVKVTLLKPSFSKNILIIDETNEKSFPFGVSATDADVDSFYAEIFGTNESWDFAKQGMPSKEVLGQYRLIVWHSDNSYSSASDYHKLPDHISDIKDYMNVGGDFIMSGWRILKSFAPSDAFPKTFTEGSFIHDYLHINVADETPLSPDFIGANGVGEVFDDIKVDSVKLASAFPYLGKLAQINIMPERAGFTDVIYSYKNLNDSQYWSYRGKACGLRYYGTSFDVVALGFPIYFIQKEDAKKLAVSLLNSMGY
ncbi:MAG: hypothetical protein WC602_01130 [archaeon]